MRLIFRLFSTSTLLPESKRLGDIPGTRHAYSEAFRLAWPLILSSLLVTLASAIDTMMVGSLGTIAIAAIGIANPIRTLIVNCYIALEGGIAVIIARRVGEGAYDEANEVLRQGFLLVMALSAILIPPMFIFGKKLILLCGAHPEHFPDALNYYYIWLGGVFIWSFASIANSALRSQGNMRPVMFSTVFSHCINIILNYILINGKLGFPALGVTGAAIATTISFFFQAGISLFFIIGKKRKLHITFKNKLHFDSFTVKSAIKIGFATFTTSLCLFFSSAIMVRIINSLGDASAYAAWQIVSTLHGVLLCIANGFYGAVSTLIGQNLGKKRPDLAVLYFRICMLLAGLSCIIYFIAGVFFGDTLAGLYIPDRVSDAATFRSVVRMLKIIGVTSILDISVTVYSGALTGAGDARFTSFATILTTMLIRTAAAYFLCKIPSVGIVGAWCAVIIDQAVRVILYIVRFRRGKWMQIRL